MIQLKKLFTPVDSLDADEAKTYMARHPEGTYTILDVRQPREYEEEHLPGARLIPLPDLADRRGELDPEQPTIVHCAVGGRSRVAAQMLSGWGFREVYNLAGGILAFQGRKAVGPQELNLDLVRGDETPFEIIRLAYGMEQALKFFYDKLREQSSDPELKALFHQLAQVEERHKQRLAALAAEIGGEAEAAALGAGATPETMEGGFQVEEFMSRNAPQLQTVPGVLEAAMMLETQALDLYLRFAERSSQAPTRQVLFGLAEEEKAHLASLGRLLEEKLERKN